MPPHVSIKPEVTAGICCSGNLQSLSLCVSGILNSESVPGKIHVLLNGKFSTENFYLAQLLDMAEMLRVRVEMEIRRTKGVREARDLLLESCRTDRLWMVDDDAVPAYWCLGSFYDSMAREPITKDFAFLAGSKNDVNNRRNYPVFSMQPVYSALIEGEPNHNLVYDSDCFDGVWYPASSLDSGNVLLNMPPIREKKITYTLFDEHRNASGDGTGFCLNMLNAGLRGAFVPAARAYHLEKPSGGFNEFEARAEMLLRTCDAKGWDRSVLHDTFMPGTWPEQKI